MSAQNPYSVPNKNPNQPLATPAIEGTVKTVAVSPSVGNSLLQSQGGTLPPPQTVSSQPIPAQSSPYSVPNKNPTQPLQTQAVESTVKTVTAPLPPIYNPPSTSPLPPEPGSANYVVQGSFVQKGAKVTVAPNGAGYFVTPPEVVVQKQKSTTPDMSMPSVNDILTNPFGSAEKAGSSLVSALGFASDIATQKGGGNNRVVKEGNTLYGVLAWGSNIPTEAKNAAGGIIGIPSSPLPFQIRNSQQQAGATAAPFIAAAALAPVTGGASLLYGGLNVGISEAFNFLPKIPYLNPNPTGKFDTNLQTIGSTFLEGELFAGAGKGIGEATRFIAQQDIPIISRVAQVAGGLDVYGVPQKTVAATAGRIGTSVATQAGLGYAIGGPQGAFKGAIFGAAIGGVNEASIRGVTVDSITSKVNMPDTSNLSNRFLNRFFPDWSTSSVKVSEVGTFKEPTIYDVNPSRQIEPLGAPYKPTGLDTIPQRLGLPNYASISEPTDIFTPAETTPIFSTRAKPILDFNEPYTPTFKSPSNANSWGFDRTNTEPQEQSMMQRESTVKPKQTTYAEPNQFPDADRLIKNSWGFTRNSGLASPARTGQIDIYGKPITDIDSFDLDTHTLERINAQPQANLNPFQRTNQISNPFIDDVGPNTNPFSLALVGSGSQPQAATNPFQNPSPTVNFFAIPGLTQGPNSNPFGAPNPKPQPNPFVEPNPNPTFYPNPKPQPNPSPNEDKNPSLPSSPFTFPGGKMEGGGYSLFNVKIGGLNSRKKVYPILSGEDVLKI